MIKAIFFDVDGTLVSFDTHTIPQSAIDAVHEVRQKGIKVFIATGRPMPFIDNLTGLEYDGIMSVNGACFKDSDGNVIFKKPVGKEDVRRMVDYARSTSLGVTFATNEGAFTVNPNGRMTEVFELLNIPEPKPADAEMALREDVMQVIAFFGLEEEPEIMSNVLKGCDAHRWHPYFADCIIKGTNKASGIDDVIRHYGIDISETMAFGDGGNDIAMLSHVGIGVAMGNATDDVKKYAKIVTDSVDNDGIAKILHSIDKF